MPMWIQGYASLKKQQRWQTESLIKIKFLGTKTLPLLSPLSPPFPIFIGLIICEKSRHSTERQLSSPVTAYFFFLSARRCALFFCSLSDATGSSDGPDVFNFSASITS